MLVLGFDTETTGLDTAKEHIIEIGAVLWDTEKGKPVDMMNRLIRIADGIKLEHKITELTGIVLEDLTNYGVAFNIIALQFIAMVNQAEAIVAHNGNLFDKPIMISNCERHNVNSEPIAKKLWVDTTCDIEFPPEIMTRKLTHLAAEHGFLNPFAHRAIFDVLTMMKIAQRYDWQQIIRYAKTPSVELIANTNFQQKELAKKLNYRWNGEKKIWTKSVKLFQVDQEREAATLAGFTIKQGKNATN